MKDILLKDTIIVGTNGNNYYVDGLISNGTGQGDIYKVHNNCNEIFALKLFHNGDNDKQLKQIKRLIKRGKACDAFVIPMEVIKFKGKVGYIMEYVDNGYISSTVLFNGIEEEDKIYDLPWEDKLFFLKKITDAFAVLSRAKLGVIDIKFENIMINLDSYKIKILDTDTIIYKNDKSIIRGTVGFMPPKTYTKQENPNEYNDAYAIAVMIFMTLLGAHPLEGKRRNEPCNENIDMYLFGSHPLYMFNPTDDSNRPIPQDEFGRNQQQVIDKYNKYPQYFKDAMMKTFVEGLFDGVKRTSIIEWGEIIERLYEDSYVCENCGEEQFYGSAFKVCSQCKQKLNKPIFMVSEFDKKVALFNDLTISANDIFLTNGNHDVFKVVPSQYDGRFGLKNLSTEKATLIFPNGKEVDFKSYEIIPIFFDSEIEIENHKIHYVLDN